MSRWWSSCLSAGAPQRSRSGSLLAFWRIISSVKSEFTIQAALPLFEVFQPFHQHVKVDGLRRVKIILIPEGFFGLLLGQAFVEGVLPAISDVFTFPRADWWHTIDSITTQGRFNDETISRASEVFPDPLLPAMPMMLVSAQGGE